jgi:hypothetical protein
MNRQKVTVKPLAAKKQEVSFTTRPVVIKMAAPQKNGEKIITRIVQRANTRSRKDIQTWRTALMRAENILQPSRALMYNLYDELVLDNHISSLMDKYRFHVNGKVFQVINKKTKQVDADKTDYLNKEWFIELMELEMDTIFIGHSLVQFNEITPDNVAIELVPRRHVVPEFGAFTIQQMDINYIPYRSNPDMMKYLIEIGKPNQFGLLCKAAPTILFKKNATIAWSEYCDIFGMPMRVGKTNSRNTQDLDRMESALSGMGKAAYAVINEGEEVSFIESTKGDAFNVYDKFIERLNSELSKLVLGETMTTDVGANGSRAQATVHEDVSDKVEDYNMQRVKRMVETKLFPLLTSHGISFEGMEFNWMRPKKVSKDSHEQDVWLNETFEIDPEHFAEKYGVPIKGVKVNAGGNNTDPLKADLKKALKGGASNIARMHYQIQELYKKHTH